MGYHTLFTDLPSIRHRQDRNIHQPKHRFDSELKLATDHKSDSTADHSDLGRRYSIRRAHDIGNVKQEALFTARSWVVEVAVQAHEIDGLRALTCPRFSIVNMRGAPSPPTPRRKSRNLSPNLIHAPAVITPMRDPTDTTSTTPTLTSAPTTTMKAGARMKTTAFAVANKSAAETNTARNGSRTTSALCVHNHLREENNWLTNRFDQMLRFAFVVRTKDDTSVDQYTILGRWSSNSALVKLPLLLAFVRWAGCHRVHKLFACVIHSRRTDGQG